MFLFKYLSVKVFVEYLWFRSPAKQAISNLAIVSFKKEFSSLFTHYVWQYTQVILSFVAKPTSARGKHMEPPRRFPKILSSTPRIGKKSSEIPGEALEGAQFRDIKSTLFLVVALRWQICIQDFIISLFWNT